jgi:MFS family permease
VTYKQLLKANASIRYLWAGQVVSEIGDWLNNIAVLALAIELAGAGRQGLALAVYALARHVPLFVFGPIAGVVADRVDRRHLMIAADVARSGVALGFLFANVWRSLTMIFITGAVLFCASSFFNAAKRATIPNLTNGTGELASANSLTASTTAATIALGSALGGISAAFLGRNIVFVLNAVTFLISAEMIRRINFGVRSSEFGVQSAKHKAQSSFFNLLSQVFFDFRDGIHYVRRVNLLWTIFIVVAGWGLGNGAARATYSLFGARFGEVAASGLVKHPADFGISVLFVAMGLGGVLGAPLARRFILAGPESLGQRMGLSIFFDGCGLALFSLMPSLWVAALVLVLREINFVIWWTAQQTMMMSNTEDRFAGRVFASFETLTTLTMIGAMLVAGAAVDTIGIKAVALCGGFIIAFSGLSWFVLSREEKSKTKFHITTDSETD